MSAYSADEGQPVLLEQGDSTGLVMKGYLEVICSELGVERGLRDSRVC